MSEQLPYGLQLAVNTMQALGCGESSEAIRAEHAQRVTMQHHAADMAQALASEQQAHADTRHAHDNIARELFVQRSAQDKRIAELEAANAALLERARTLEGDNQRLESERDAMRARLAEIEAQEPVPGVVLSEYGPALVRIGKETEHAARRVYARPVPAQAVPDVDKLAQHIRTIDGCNSLGAGALAERIVKWMAAQEHKA